MDNCPERVDAEAPRPPRIKMAGMALEAVLALEALEVVDAL